MLMALCLTIGFIDSSWIIAIKKVNNMTKIIYVEVFKVVVKLRGLNNGYLKTLNIE